MDALTGQTIKGYAIQHHIGQGAFGVVYRAHQAVVEREVAIKVILPQYANQPDFVRRFETEAQLVAHLEHIHIVPLYDYWRDPTGAYLVMRYLRGGNLRDWLVDGPLSPEQVLRIIEQIARALDLAHHHAIIHRDIKPTNILLDEERNAFLTDFGLAKVMGHESGREGLLGTPEYISPEQVQGQEVSPQSDLYSLGLVLYEMLVGQPAFRPSNMAEMVELHLKTSVPAITTQRDDLPDTINDVLQTATAKTPADRYPNALALAHALRKALATTPAARIEPVAPLIEPLTDRELDVLRLMAQGLSNRKIAEQLVIALSTVKWYVRQIYGKLGVSKRRQALVAAQHLNLLATKPGAAVPFDLALPEWMVGDNPYKGLEAFQQADAANFFGREALVEHLVSCLNDESELNRFLAVVGPSGSGKSSVVRAGLLSALAASEIPGSERWFVADMLPGAHPIDKLEVALMRIAAHQADNLYEHLTRDERGLTRIADLILPDDGSELVIFIDQFEEVFTLVDDEGARQQFLDLVRAAVTEPHSRVRIVVTLRADYYDRPLQYPAIGELVHSRMVTVLPLSATELERAITGPAERVGVTFEDGLVAQMVAETTRQPGALPLLQYALTELFEHRASRTLTHAAYQQIGGAVGALANRADEIYLSLTDEAQDLAHQMFMRLVTLGEGADDTRRRATHAELLSLTDHPDLMQDIIDQFAEYRLLSLDHDPESRQPTVEVAHEAILRDWDRLRQWLNESRHDIRQEWALARAAEEWNAHKRDASYLLRGARLDQVETWRNVTSLIQTPLEHQFTQASLNQREQERAAEIARQAQEARLERRSRNFVRGLVAVFAAATVISAGFGLLAMNRQNRATSAQAEAEYSAAEFRSVALASVANQTLDDGQPDVALALALEAVRMDSPPLAAEQALFEAASSTWIRQRYIGHEARLNGVDFSPDGQTALTAGWDGRVILWNVETGDILKTFQYPETGAKLSAVTFHPGGHLAAISGIDIGIILWNLETDEVTQPVTGEGTFFHPSFSSDGQWLVFGAGMVIKMLDVESGDVVREFEGHDGFVMSTDVSPDDRLMVSASLDGTVKMWDVETGELLQTLEHPPRPGHVNEDKRWIYRALFLADGKRVISCGTDHMMYLWDWQTGEILQTFEGLESSPFDITISPDERYVATGENSGVGRLWSVETGELMRTYYGHTGRIEGLQFSPDGRTILTASHDQTAILWDVWGVGLRYTIPLTPNWWTSQIAISPSGKRFAIVGGDGVIRVRDVASGEEVQAFGEHRYKVWALAYSPDGRFIISGYNRDATIEEPKAYVWDAETGELLRSLEEPTSGFGVDFSPDGRIAALSELVPPRITLWDTETWQLLHILEGHRDWVLDTVFGPDGSILYSGSLDQTIRVWDPHTGESLGILAQNAGVWVLDITDDGKRLLAGVGWQAVILDTETGEQLVTFTGHSDAVTSAEFSPDERYVLTSADDGRLILWDAVNGQPIQSVVNDPSGGWLMGGVTPDGQTVISGGIDDISVWDVSPLLQDYKSWVVNNRYVPDFTCEQRALYAIEPLCEAGAE